MGGVPAAIRRQLYAAENISEVGDVQLSRGCGHWCRDAAQGHLRANVRCPSSRSPTSLSAHAQVQAHACLDSPSRVPSCEALELVGHHRAGEIDVGGHDVMRRAHPSAA